MTASLTKVALAAVAAAGATGAGAAVWGIGIERYLFTVRYHALRILPPNAEAIRVLHLSDAHMAPWQRRKQGWIAALADLRPDLIINTGDNIGHRDALVGLREAYAPLAGIPGVFVHGSNDFQGPSFRNPLRYFSGPSQRRPEVEEMDVESLDAYLSDELGWAPIDNAATSLEVRGTRITAFGVNDAHRDWDDLSVLPDAIGGLDEPDLTLGVTHAPYRRVLDAFVDLGADALFAGHTHGGQVRIPGSPEALVANCDIPLDQARGLSEWTHADTTVPLNVSAGLGHSIFAPVRFACRPEVSLLTLLPR
ncbi:metallophosphoesterase [Microbacterium sp. P07]|uniref:metallophosphoesterase n=1 Tax=Microbacterium sp. P07 TaxID=3366952 RepID=UPI00374507BD